MDGPEKTHGLSDTSTLYALNRFFGCLCRAHRSFRPLVAFAKRLSVMAIGVGSGPGHSSGELPWRSHMRHMPSVAVLVAALSVAGCSDDASSAHDPEAVAQSGAGATTPGSDASGSNTAGAVASSGAGGRRASGSGGVPATGSGGSEGRAGATATSGGGASGGGTTDQDDAGADGQVAPAPVDVPDLNVYSDTSSIEFTPALLAARSFYPGKATVNTGGIADLFSGRADLATNAETQALRQSAQHPDLRIIFTVTETFYRIVARRSAGISQLSDLRGKRVATVPNTSAHYYLDLMLRTAGLSAVDVTVVSAFPLTRLPDLLTSGQADAATSWEPEPQNAVDRLGDDAIEFQDRSIYREIVNLHATEATLANPQMRRGVVEFVRALIAATKRYRDAPEEVWPLVADATGYQPALIEKVWRNEQFAGTLAPDLLDVLEREEPWVAQQSSRMPRGRQDLAKLIDDSVLRDAVTAR